MAIMNLLEYSQKIPKAELHVHLEGSIHPAILLELAERNHIEPPAPDLDGLREFYRFRSFPHFIEVYLKVTGYLRTPEDYQLIAYQFGCDCARQNIRYAEVTFTMVTNVQKTGLPWQVILEGLNAGRAQARQEFGVYWRWVFDINRGDPGTQAQLADIAIAAQGMGVVALGLGGNEDGFPASLFTETFERARKAGLHSDPHAGEVAGPESVWAALDQLHAERIGHGVRSIEDPRLVEALRERCIPLEVCPTSNVRLRVYPDYAHHPLRKLWEAGLVLTVNSDDPPMFNTELNYEYQALVEQFGFSADELERVSLNAVRSSFLPQEEKERLEVEFQAEMNNLRSDLKISG